MIIQTSNIKCRRVLCVFSLCGAGEESVHGPRHCVLRTHSQPQSIVEDGANCTDQPAGKGRRAGTTPGDERRAPPGQTDDNETTRLPEMDTILGAYQIPAAPTRVHYELSVNACKILTLLLGLDQPKGRDRTYTDLAITVAE